jgi:hypothetical protein
MNGPWKSDRPVVPTKRPNEEDEDLKPRPGQPYAGTKAETPETDKGTPTVAGPGIRSTEEAVEGSGLAKGNTHQTTTFRPQSREDVLPGLERVREAAKRFHARRGGGSSTRGRSRMR